MQLLSANSRKPESESGRLEALLYPRLLAVILTLIGAVRIVSTYHVFSHVIDEPDHLAAGMQWLNTGKYTYEDQHPPLARVFGALGPYLAGERWHRELDAYREGYRILGFDAHYDRTLSLARFGILPFFLLASAVVFLWAQRAGGDLAAITATLLFTTLPPVLGHAGLVTTDIAATACTGAAALASLYWWDHPNRRRSLILGGCIGLAALAKFSCLLFLPAIWLGFWMIRRERIVWSAAALVAIAAFLTIWAGYRFSFARGLPAPHFFSGLETLWHHNRTGHLSYLFGKTSMTGFWYYFPAALLLKTPVALLVTTGIAALYQRSREALYPVAYAAVILFAASFVRINIGVRHILPLYLGACVAASLIAVRPRWKWLALPLITWQIGSGIAAHPDYLAYTNELAGSHPERYLVDSDLDWGQDMNRLADKMSKVGANQLAFEPFNRTYSTLAGHHLPIVPLNAECPSPGWNAVSFTMWKLYKTPRWVNKMELPPERIGRSILLWNYSGSLSMTAANTGTSEVTCSPK